MPYGDQAVLSASPSLLPVLPPRRVGARNKATGGARLVSLESDKRFLAQADNPVASNENDTEIRCRFLLTPVNWGGRG